MAAVLLLLIAVTVGYQAVYCYTSTGGAWTGLFCSGDRMPHPAELDRGFRLQDSFGYDGQIFRVLAHDPLNRKGYWRYLDDARYRSGRILIPALAALLGGGSRRAVDFWFIAVVDASLVLGGLCFVRLSGDACPGLAAVAVYCTIPAVVASTDRMVVDGPLAAAFLAAWLFIRRERRGALWAVLACAPLIREAGILVNAGAALLFLRRRDLRGTLISCATTLPALAWWWWVAVRTPASDVGTHLSIPLLPQIARMFHIVTRPVAAWRNAAYHAIVVASVLCLFIAFGTLAWKLWRWLRRHGIEDDVLLVLPSAILAAFASTAAIVYEPYGWARIDSVLLEWAGLRLLQDWRRLAAYAYLPVCGSGLLLFRWLPLWQFVQMLAHAGGR
jgi:hypothetical protein